MATRKLLNIVVDGNSALGPYWPKIVSDYLEKIVRSLIGNPRGEGVNPSCEVGLILYNFNSTLGLDYVQCFNWTKDVDQFLGFLAYLPFNGDNLNQHTIVKGLAEALVMFPKDDYFKCERHCILVATGEPVTRSMLVSLPVVKEGKFISGQFITLDATFLRVAKMFGPLGVSLSVVTPNCHPLFISIFNLGNYLKEDTPITNYGNGQITVLLSRNFKEAHYAVLIPQETALEEDRLTRLLEQDHQIYLDEILEEMLRSSTSTTGEGSLPQNNSDSGRLEELNAWYSPGVGASSFVPTARVDVGASSGGIAGPSASTDAGVVAGAIASSSLYYGSHHQQFPKHHHFEMTEINPTAMGANTWASPALVMHEYNQAILWPKPPTDFIDYVQAWEVNLLGSFVS
ncbi:Mediator of RNA polymerase II transcription subunit 25 [Glycine max]|nr:Mediator of RNA polymerase II transcription subunit 25 [Glycine max]